MNQQQDFAVLGMMDPPDWKLDVEQRWQQAAEAALVLGELSLVRKLCTRMREARPNHLDARYYEARLALARQDLGRARPLLEGLLQSDPEHWPARWALGAILLKRGDTAAGLALCRQAALRGGPALEQMIREKVPLTVLQRWEQHKKEEQPAVWEESWTRLVSLFQETQAVPEENNPKNPLFRALQESILLEVLWRGGAWGSARRLANRLISKFPEMVKPRLLLAEWLATDGERVKSASLLHDARVSDPGGRVARRLGLPMVTIANTTEPPEKVITLLDRLPTSIQQALQDEKIAQAPVAVELPGVSHKRKKSDSDKSAVVEEINDELTRIQERVRTRLPKVETKNLATAEVIIAAREPLVRQYGEAAAQLILDELGTLASTIEGTDSMRSHLIVLDDPATLAPWKLGSVEPSNAAAIKGLLDRLDKKMEKSGERLAYILLVGGHEILPHHRLPNPVDDHDMDVPSDNPYAARGDNYLIPTRAVGRLPHESHSPDLLLGQIHRLQKAWQDNNVQGKGVLGDWLAQVVQHVPGGRRALAPGESWGLAAQVWQRAATAVFRTLDSETELAFTPPLNAQQWESDPPPSVPFYYFNVHGIEESGSWYGQVDPHNPDNQEAYPIALTPAQLHRLKLQRAIIFSEACYGANPHVSRAADSMALTAIQQGSSIYVGSTKIAYATFAPPLLAADLLAALFWRAIAEGAPGGVALQQAKVQLAETMMQRTGYLDVEEQKTLTSFILYGDPALPLVHRPRNANPEALRQLAAKTQRSSLYQVSSKSLPAQPLDSKMLEAVKFFAAPYLQGVRGALRLRSHLVSVSHSPPPMSGSPGEQVVHAKQVETARDQWHVTVTQSAEQAGVLHRQVLTMRVSKSGKVLQSHVSR